VFLLTASGTMFGAWSLCLKLSHRKCHCLLQVYCTLETAHCSQNMHRPVPQSYFATLKWCEGKTLGNDVNSSVTRRNITDVVTIVFRQTAWFLLVQRWRASWSRRKHSVLGSKLFYTFQNHFLPNRRILQFLGSNSILNERNSDKTKKLTLTEAIPLR